MVETSVIPVKTRDHSFGRQVREKMIGNRERLGATRKDMAYWCKVSEGLVRIVEEGGVTHPNIADRMRQEYGLTEEETAELIPVFRRKGSRDYDPNRYKQPDNPSDFRRTLGPMTRRDVN